MAKLAGGSAMTDHEALLRQLRRAGFFVWQANSSHLKVQRPDGGPTATLALTPSDRRGVHSARAHLKRILGFDVKPARRKSPSKHKQHKPRPRRAEPLLPPAVRRRERKLAALYAASTVLDREQERQVAALRAALLVLHLAPPWSHE